jgi:quinohemoprotein ethanol dehydrogenase
MRPQFGSPEIISPGQKDYDRTHIACPGVISGGAVPDLRYAYAMTAWGQIVANGIMSSGGIVGFKDDSPKAEIEAICAFVTNRAQAEAQAKNAQ